MRQMEATDWLEVALAHQCTLAAVWVEAVIWVQAVLARTTEGGGCGSSPLGYPQIGQAVVISLQGYSSCVV
ncbi:unnamed protein product [Prunus armeniaca]